MAPSAATDLPSSEGGVKKRSSSPGRTKDSKDADAKKQARPKLTAQGSVYALTPDRRWLHPSLAFPAFAATLLLTLALCFFLRPTYEFLRLYYTFVGVGLLCYRIYYYAYREWILYFIDLCFVNSILLIWSLWNCTEGRCSQGWLLAVFIVAQGPVAGATFPLQTPLTLHHPEAFESFFMHASPMWISYSVRWRWPQVLSGSVPSVGELVSIGFWKIYFPWSMAYLAFLLVQPFLPDKIAGFETLMDGFIFPASSAEQRRVGKRQGFLSYAPKVLAMTLVHALLSCSGFVAAALSYQYHSVQVAWISCVLAGCLTAGARFYHQSATPDYVAPGVWKGFANMALAWAVVLPTYLYAALGDS